jgi:triacylglycerol lipase
MIIPKLNAPIVLAHGLLGHAELRVGSFVLTEYFPGISKMLRDRGNRVLLPSVGLTHGVAERAAHLKAFLDREVPGEAVHIIAHSMGGLDARYMISRLGMERRVLTLTTLGTPHRGSSFADWGVKNLRRVVRPLLHFFGMPTQAFIDLTTMECQRFNEEVPDAPGVRYFSVGGRHEGGLLTPEWFLSYNVVLECEGVNDGVVSLQSAKWGESFDVWEGDHFSLVNWLNPFATNRGWGRDPAPRYGPLVQRLAELEDDKVTR